MIPERIRAWLGRRPASAKRVQLLVETATGNNVLSDWERKDIEEMAKTGDVTDVAAAITDQCKEHTQAEEKAQRFLIRWVGDPNDRVLKSLTHRVPFKPSDEGDEPISLSEMTLKLVQDLLQALKDKDKLINSSLETVTKSHRDTTELLTAQLVESNKIIRAQSRKEPIPVKAEVVQLTGYEREESEARVAALTAATTKIPEAIDLLITAGANYLLRHGDGAAAPATNGGGSTDDTGAH